MLRHNKVVALMYAGYKGGEVVVLAAAEQDRPSYELLHELEIWHIVGMTVHDLWTICTKYAKPAAHFCVRPLTAHMCMPSKQTKGKSGPGT